MRAFATLTAAAVLAVALFAGGATGQSSVGERYGLHPVCGGVRRFQVRQERTLLTREVSKELEVSCFSFNFMHNSCVASSPGRVLLDIVDQETQLGQTVDFGNIYRGSMYATAFHFNTTQAFTLYAMYPDYSDCPAVFYASIYAEIETGRDVDKDHPFIVGSNPIVLYRRDPYTIRLKSPTPLNDDEQSNMRFTVINYTQRCRSAAESAYQRHVANGLQTAISFLNATDMTWTITPAHNGMHTMCVQTHPQGQWTVLAFVEAYGANPAFFDETLVREDRVRQRVTYEFEFFGYALNAERDRLILVDAPVYHVCGGAPTPSTSARVQELHQRTMNSTVTRVEIINNNLYLVCYYHAAADEWVDVSNFDYLSREVITNTSDPNQQQRNHHGALPWTGGGGSIDPNTGRNETNSPSGSEPQWLETCRSAPVDDDHITVTNPDVTVLYLRTSSLPGDLLQRVADVLCLPSAAYVQLLRATALQNGRLSVYLQIACNPMVCNSGERQQALGNLQATDIDANVVSMSTVPFDGIIVQDAAAAPTHRGDDGDGGGDSDTLWIVIGVLAALLVSAVIAIFFVVRHRRTARAAHAEADVVQGHVIEVQGAATRRQVNPITNPYGGATYGAQTPVEPVNGAEEMDNAPIPPPPEKPAATTVPTEPAAAPPAPQREADDTDDRPGMYDDTRVLEPGSSS